MALLPVLAYPDARLKQVSDQVTEFDEQLTLFVSDLMQTMDQGPPSVGIAAPQVACFKRICIVDVTGFLEINRKRKRNLQSSDSGRLVLINPVITDSSGQIIGREGCLSVPDYTGNVSRATHITLDAVDETGSK